METMRQRSKSPGWRRQSQPHCAAVDALKPRAGSDGLPSIHNLDLEKIKREAPGDTTAKFPSLAMINNMAAPPLRSPSSISTGPPPPYSYHSTASSTTALASYASPPVSRRASTDKDKDQRSLPSIHQALGNDTSLFYSSNSQPNTSINPHTVPVHTTPAPIPRTHPETVLSGPLNPFAPPQPVQSYTYDSTEHRPQPSYRPDSRLDDPRSRVPHSSTLENGPVQGQTAGSTTSSPKAPQGSHPMQPPHTSSAYPQPIQPSAPVSSQTSFHPFPNAFSYPPQTNGALPYPPQPPPPPPPQQQQQQPMIPHMWRSDGTEINRAEEVRKAATKRSPTAGQHYGESVKRHLDIFDLETSLNEIADGSDRSLGFSRKYCARAHQTQRSGPSSTSFPELEECDEMISVQVRILNSYNRIRDVIVAQQHDLAQERSRDEANRSHENYSGDTNGYPDKHEGGGGFAGADPKKRRGVRDEGENHHVRLLTGRKRNAPPGRCHSCNRAETPEWRRGPDGARTLCNACGLHYAKLTRKMGAKVSSISSSNLRPKDPGPS